ncbi:MAG TPA: tripartite tricarboxylate transporter substrate binding protein [candidate division Zixibacteria bacterium]
MKFKGMIVMMMVLLSFLGIASGQEKYPNRSITYIVGYPPGGASEVTSRALANAASKHLGQPVVIVTKPGGASAVSLAGLKSEKPDGYTIGLLPTGGITSQHLRKVSYDVVTDFTPIMHYGIVQSGIVVRTESPWKTFKELIEYAKANPGKIRYSTAGPGSPSHMVMERLTMREKVVWTHIPFEGTAPSIAAVLGGHVEVCADSTFWKPHVLSGKLRLLAAMDQKRIAFFPDVPTLREMGYDITALSVLGIVGPKGLSPQLVETLHSAFKKAMDDPDFIKVMEQMDMLTHYLGPEEYGKYLVKLNGEVGPLIQQLGLRKE